MWMSQSTSAKTTTRCLVACLVGSGFPFMWNNHSIYHKLRLDAVGRVWQESYVHSCGGVRPIAKATTGCRVACLVGFGVPFMGMHQSSCPELRLEVPGRVWLDLDVASVCHHHSTCKELRLDAVGCVGLDLDVDSFVSDIPIAKICVGMPWGGFDECWMYPVPSCGMVIPIAQTTTACLGAGLVAVGCGFICISFHLQRITNGCHVAG